MSAQKPVKGGGPSGGAGAGSDTTEPDHQVTLLRLDELDELMNISESEDQHAISKYLKTGHDLRSIIDTHDQELRALREDFIAAHIEQAEGICELYNEFTECEQKLVEFEEEIVTFQRTLADTADDIVKMQQQTNDLVRSVNNRKLVSHKINEVYSALQECEAFTGDISNKEVDKAFLLNIRELESSIAFLANNKQLQGSAVDQEIRPKLRVAAQKAGDKLQRYLGKKISALGEDLTNIGLQQRALEQTGQYAFSFLNHYNAPVAEDIKRMYVNNMSEVYLKQFRLELRELVERTDYVAASIDPIVTESVVTSIASNRDSGAPKGSQVTAQAMHFPVQPIPRRDRSVSQHVRGFADRMHTLGAPDHQGPVREARFGDLLETLNVCSIEYNVLTLDPVTANELSKTNSWMWRLTRALVLIANTCVQECRFVHQFFFFSEEDAEDAEERLDTAVLFKALNIAESTLVQELALVTDRNCLLGGLRVVEILKRYLCTQPNPIALSMLSGLIEKMTKTMRKTLGDVLAIDSQSISFLNTLHLAEFRQAPNAQATLAQILDAKPYAATLGVHPIVRTFATTYGQLELINAAPLKGSTVDASTVTVYDEVTSGAILRQIQALLQFLQSMARRHTNPLAQQLFAINNIYHIVALWQFYAERSPFTLERMEIEFKKQQQQRNLAASQSVAVSSNASTSSYQSPPPQTSATNRASGVSPTGQSPQPQNITSPNAPTSGLQSALLKFPLHTAAPASHAAEIDAHLLNSIAQLINLDSKERKAISALFSFLQSAEAALGEQFFAEGEQASGSSGEGEESKRHNSASTSITEEKAVDIVEAFAAGWQQQLHDIADTMHRAFTISNSSTGGAQASPPSSRFALGVDNTFSRGNAAAPETGAVDALAAVVLKQYLYDIVEANGKLRILVQKLFSKNTSIEAKLTNNAAVVQEVKKILGSNALPTR